jgi:co-chaperonin GroES (HSP10)
MDNLDRDESLVATFAPEQYRPLNDKVLLQVDPWNEELASGIVAVRLYEREKLLMATVLRVGPKAERDLKAGDRVLVPRQAASIEFRGPANEEWIVVSLKQLQGVYE